MSSLSWPSSSSSSSSSSSASSATIDTHKEETQTRTTTTSTSNPETGKWNSRKAALFSALVLLNLTTLVPEQTKASEAVIKISRFQVPSQVRPGEHRRLACLYELQGATLHAMKLFKDNKEFYRYTPADHKMTFPVLGVQVDLNRSGEREVWIRTGKRSGGSYKCQVSIEGTFNSVIEEKRMEVVEGPPASNWHQKEPTQRTHNNNNNLNLNRAQPVHQNQQMTFAGTTGNSNQPLSHQFFSSSSSSSGCLCSISRTLQLIGLALTSCLIFRAHLASFVPPTSHLEDKRKVKES